jgi:O-antigen ligase
VSGAAAARPGRAEGPRRSPLAAPLVAGWAGIWAAVLQYAGALKSLPWLARLPVDLTLLAALALLPALMLLAAARRWRIDPALALPLLGAAGLWLWLVLAGAWSPSRAVLAEKLPQAVLLGPVMLAAGMLVGGDPVALRRCAGAALLIGLGVGGGIALGLATDAVVLGGEPGADPTRTRVQYQIAGLAIAAAGGVAAVGAVAARGRPARLGWLGLTGLLAVAVLVPGGRLGLIGLGAAVLLAPAVLLWRHRGPGPALAWIGLGGLAGTGALYVLADMPDLAKGLETLERLFGDPNSTTSARLVLWGEALRWAGLAAPFGLGTAGFTIAAGFGDDRDLYPHNHALEALAEGGLPGLALWLLAFGGGALLALRQALSGRVAALRAAQVAALTIPVALSAMVSTDLGNRMVWFALGLLLSLAVEAEEERPPAQAGRG